MQVLVFAAVRLTAQLQPVFSRRPCIGTKRSTTVSNLCGGKPVLGLTLMA